MIPLAETDISWKLCLRAMS